MHMPCHAHAAHLQQVRTEADEVGPCDHAIAPRAAAARGGQLEGSSPRIELLEELHRIHLAPGRVPAPRRAAAPGGLSAASVDSKHRGGVPRPRYRQTPLRRWALRTALHAVTLLEPALLKAAARVAAGLRAAD